MRRQKIINDPVYGFISIPYGLFLNIIDHPVFQRLRRIKQGGFSHLVYPGAMHTRFHHTLGAFHLTGEAIKLLREKDVMIEPEEEQALQLAILLHDIGHGPFSHSLEGSFIEISHEQITLAIMRYLNRQFDGALDLAIEIFQNRYKKRFLYQLVSGQLDLDRMDYLNRDSFYTGVAEGVIGYDRIIKMLNVVDGQLVIEEKGLYSIEKFLMARRLMYWQVYYHKAVISAEHMLERFVARLKQQAKNEKGLLMSEAFRYFIENRVDQKILNDRPDEIIDRFAVIDDFDVVMVLKSCLEFSSDSLLCKTAFGLLNRRLDKTEFFFSEEERDARRAELEEELMPLLGDIEEPERAFHSGTIRITPYLGFKDEIMVLSKKGDVAPLSLWIDLDYYTRQGIKYYLSYPRV